MFRTYFEYRRRRKLFEQYLSGATAEAARLSDAPAQQSFTVERVEYVLIFVEGEKPEHISAMVGQVTEMAMSHDGLVYSILGALVLVSFGGAPGPAPAAGSRAAFVTHLSGELQRRVKMVHGAADAHHGFIGTSLRMSYSLLLPRFDAMLGALSRLEFGRVEEFVI
ncbi:hypothetical protein [Prosthecobacter sp.]|uniref:hypothetical protein n=1 Tax=Prosthecobacter sp. TaxID=1965333 RepID=UPI003784316C